MEIVSDNQLIDVLCTVYVSRPSGVHSRAIAELNRVSWRSIWFRRTAHKNCSKNRTKFFFFFFCLSRGNGFLRYGIPQNRFPFFLPTETRSAKAPDTPSRKAPWAEVTTNNFSELSWFGNAQSQLRAHHLGRRHRADTCERERHRTDRQTAVSQQGQPGSRARRVELLACCLIPKLCLDTSSGRSVRPCMLKLPLTAARLACAFGMLKRKPSLHI